MLRAGRIATDLGNLLECEALLISKHDGDPDWLTKVAKASRERLLQSRGIDGFGRRWPRIGLIGELVRKIAGGDASLCAATQPQGVVNSMTRNAKYPGPDR